MLILLLWLVDVGWPVPRTSAARAELIVPGAMRQAETDRVELRVGAAATVRDGRTRVTFVGVRDDSRCPIGVTCLWEGDAVVQLRVETEHDPAIELLLHANAQFSQKGTAGPLTVTLLELHPRPRADEPVAADGYTAVVEIVAR